MLLLGPGESGKSTVFKQMKILQDNGGYKEEELVSFRNIIYLNCISQMRQLIMAAARLQTQFQSEGALKAAQKVLQLQQHGLVNWTPDIGDMIALLWRDKGIKDTYALRGHKFHLNDTADYFFDQLERVNRPDYLPSVADVLRCRVSTTGIEEAQFIFDGLLFTLVDVGGQRSERRKWIHCFDNVTAVLYCADMACYDLVLREDSTQNRMTETLLLFQEVTSYTFFKDRAIIVFLNKTDLFAIKIKYVDLRAYMPDYNGGPDYEKACNFLRDKFLSQSTSGAKLHVHFTCALDTRNIHVVVRGVLDTIMGKTLENAGIDMT